jgi:NSS family neurotransmitter:Na+ symporter
LSDPAFNFFDMITNNVFLTLGAFCMSIFVGWIWGIPNFAKTAGIESNPALVNALGFVIRYLAPLIIVVFSLSLFGVI